MSSATPAFSLQVTVVMAPENVPEYLKHFRPVFEKAIAEKECTFFQVYQSQEDKGKLSWVETWTGVTKEWFFDVQIKKEYMTPYFEATEPLLLKEREFKFLDVVPGFTYQPLK